MKFRRHHNNTGLRGNKSGSRSKELQKLARKLGVPFGKKSR